jgi:hypothetical protein
VVGSRYSALYLFILEANIKNPLQGRRYQSEVSALACAADRPVVVAIEMRVWCKDFVVFCWYFNVLCRSVLRWIVQGAVCPTGLRKLAVKHSRL